MLDLGCYWMATGFFGEVVIKRLASVNQSTPVWSAAASQAEVIAV